MELLGLSYGVIARKNCKLFGETLTEAARSEVIGKAGKGELDVVIATLGVGKNGCNLQGCNWMITLNPMTLDSDEIQAQGSPNNVDIANTRAVLQTRAREEDPILYFTGGRR